MQHKAVISSFWNAFLEETNRDKSLQYSDCYYFADSEKLANGLLELVLNGVKKATASSLYYYEKNNMPMPKAGDLCVITDWAGTPRCVIETTAVTVLAFQDITFDICGREGEDDCLESWQRGHIGFFTREGEAIGYRFTWDMPVVFEDFKVVYTG